MAAFNKKQGLWREKSSHFLFKHKALANVFRAKMLAGIKKLGLALPERYPEEWVVDCKAVDKGDKVLR